MTEECICALATPAGGAIGIIRLSGEKSIEITDQVFTSANGKPLAEAKPYTIHYGDIRHMAGYHAATMGLRSTDYARNSKGKSVPVREVGWAAADETPTHLILQFSSSDGGAYIGTPGNTLWIDNVSLVY